jgi:hypothetical protein
MSALLVIPATELSAIITMADLLVANLQQWSTMLF